MSVSADYLRSVTIYQVHEDADLFFSTTSAQESEESDRTVTERPVLSLLNWLFDDPSRRYRVRPGFEVDAAPRNWPR